MNQFNYGTGVYKELEAAYPGDKILESLVFIACWRKTNGKENFEKKIWRGYRTLESKNIQSSSTLRHSLCLLFSWELFHLQTPNVLLFPKRHCADIFSEGIIYMSDESKNLPLRKSPIRSLQIQIFLINSSLLLFPFSLSWYKLSEDIPHQCENNLFVTPTNSPSFRDSPTSRFNIKFKFLDQCLFPE